VRDERAWEKQSESLIEVQKFGTQLEKKTRELLGWDSGRAIYDSEHDYKLQTDASWPSIEAPKAILSVTYTNPDKPGHSNENKLQLKIGELALLKNAFPGVRLLLVIGGTQEAWLPYVLEAFKYFFDEVIFLWDADSALVRIREIQKAPLSIPLKNVKLWEEISHEWKRIKLAPPDDPVPGGLVRYKIADELKNEDRNIQHPKHLKNEILRLCMQCSFDFNGIEWKHFKEGRWERIEMSRNYFNPLEASVELSLSISKFKYHGGVGKDVEVPSLLHKLGMKRTKLSEDFVLISKKLNRPVYIQCKSSGGGREQHGKNIQNRTKEQITRSLFYRCDYRDGTIKWTPKDYHWISVVDGDWGVTREQPAKYIHMLQWAGYDRIIGSEELLNSDLNVKRENNPLVEYLKNIDCETL